MNKARSGGGSSSGSGVNAGPGGGHMGSSSWSSGPPSVDPGMTSLSQHPWAMMPSHANDNNSHCSEDIASSPM